MTYIYDLVLNFNSEYYDFYEWNKDDNYLHIKKIGLIKVDSKTYNDIFDYKVKFLDVVNHIFNKCEYYEKKQIKNIPYAFLLTDGYRTMAINLNNDLIISHYSSLLLDEEEEILEIAKNIPIIKISYNKISKNVKDNYTRWEKRILEYIALNLNQTFIQNDLEKIKYLYYEYFNKESMDINYMYNALIKSLDEFNIKHYNLYNLIKLSSKNSQNVKKIDKYKNAC